MTESIIYSAASVAIVAIICAAATYGCVNTNRHYYAAMSECVQSGGSAVPIGQGDGSSIVCIRK
jgi:hypothetical protein